MLNFFILCIYKLKLKYKEKTMNMFNMIKQARQLQSKIKETQKNLNKSIIEGSAGNNSVVITMTGDQKLKSVTINPENIKNNNWERELLLCETTRNVVKCHQHLLDVN